MKCVNTFCCSGLIMFVRSFKTKNIYIVQPKHIIFNPLKLFYDLKSRVIFHFE